MKTSTPSSPSLRRWAGVAALAFATLLAQSASAAPGHHGPGYGQGPGHGGGRHAMGQHGGPGMGMGMGQGRQMAHALDAVQATPEQRAQIDQLMQTARTERQAHREAGRALREQSQALFAAPTVDARALDALRQQQLALHAQASERAMQLKLGISRVLTPEQRKQMVEHQQQRHAMMERHQAERRALQPQR